MNVKLRTLLAACLYFVTARPSFAQKIKQGTTDNKIIRNEIYQLNYDLVKDDIDIIHKANKAFIDSIVLASKTHYDQGDVSYAPDGKFKIFVFQGEQCGASCSNIYNSLLYFTGKKYHVAFASDFLPITKIVKLQNDEYLVLQKGVTGNNIYINDNLIATIVVFKINGVFIKPFSFKRDNEHWGPKGSLCISQNQFVLEDDNNNNILEKFRLVFNPTTKRLTYCYVRKPISTEKVYLYTGYFDRVNDGFIQRSDKKILLK